MTILPTYHCNTCNKDITIKNKIRHLNSKSHIKNSVKVVDETSSILRKQLEKQVMIKTNVLSQLKSEVLRKQLIKQASKKTTTLSQLRNKLNKYK